MRMCCTGHPVCDASSQTEFAIQSNPDKRLVQMVSEIHILVKSQDSNLILDLLIIWWVSESTTKSHTRKYTGSGARQIECKPPPHFRFNSPWIRLGDSISCDIEPGTQWNRTPGSPNHPRCSAPLVQANQIPSRLSRWSISTSPFSGWDYLLGTVAVPFLTSGYRMLMLSQNIQTGMWFMMCMVRCIGENITVRAVYKTRSQWDIQIWLYRKILFNK